MQKTSRLSILNWVKNTVAVKQASQTVKYATMKQQLLKLIADLEYEIAEEMLHAEQKEKLSFELFKTYTLLYYCSELLTETALSETNTCTGKVSRLFTELSVILDDAMQNIVKQYSHLFDTANLPVSKKERGTFISNHLTTIHDIGTQLKQQYMLYVANLFYSYILQLCLQPGLCYHALTYTGWVLHYLKNCFENDADQPKEWIHLFIRINFNTQEVLAQCSSHIQATIEKLDTATEKLQKINQLLYQIRNIPAEEDKALNPKTSSVKQHITAMLHDIKLLYEQSGNSCRQESGKEEDPGKISTSFSVEQLAAFIRVLKEEKILTETNTNRLCKQVTALFKTEKTEEIAFNSFQSKFYKIERRTAQTMKDLFITLHNKSRLI